MGGDKAGRELRIGDLLPRVEQVPASQQARVLLPPTTASPSRMIRTPGADKVTTGMSKAGRREPKLLQEQLTGHARQHLSDVDPGYV